jgi:hypothetical protein
MDIDLLADWFGADTIRRRLERIRAFWGGAERFLVTVNSTKAAYRQIFDDARILASAPVQLRHQATLPGVNLPTFFADFGTVSTAKHWGGTTRFPEAGGNIFIDPVASTVTEALAIAPAPPDRPDLDAHRALRLYRALRESLPTESLWFRMPDLQGPLNTAGLVMKQDELLMAMVTEPESVHRFLRGIAEWMVAYVRYCRDASGGRLCGYIWPYTFFPADLGVAITEDLMPLLAVETYREFALPYLRALGRAFGGLQIHCCGRWGRHAPTLREAGVPIRAVEYHYPFTSLEQLACLAPETVFVPYITLDQQREFGSATAYYDHLLRTTDERHRFWFAFAEDTDEAVAFARSRGF